MWTGHPALLNDPTANRESFVLIDRWLARMVAGGPLSDDVLKCALKPLDRDDYDVAFSGEQWSRLNSAFPSGACDFRKPGVAQQPSIPWLTFSDGPGGRALGPPPVSTR